MRVEQAGRQAASHSSLSRRPGLGIVVLALVALGQLACPDPPSDVLEPIQTIPCDACGGDCVTEQYPFASGVHILGGIDYELLPPVGDNHDPCWAELGVHASEVPDERWVHNLEHGAIVYLYNCPEGCAEDTAILEGLVGGLAANTTLLSPYSLMESRVAAVSWSWRLLMGCADEAMLSSFYDEHVDQAPESTTAGPSPDCME